MSSNYEWQKQLTNQRIQARMQQSAAERQVVSTPRTPGLWTRLFASLRKHRKPVSVEAPQLRPTEAQR